MYIEINQERTKEVLVRLRQGYARAGSKHELQRLDQGIEPLGCCHKSAIDTRPPPPCIAAAIVVSKDHVTVSLTVSLLVKTRQEAPTEGDCLLFPNQMSERFINP